jgi:hypothetical protein
MLREIGFWDYTCPHHGSLEEYSLDDWDQLLDDMSVGGFNSLVLGIKWVTTGYRSKYSWLDQDVSVAAIATDNATIFHALRGARQRGIKIWLLVVGSIFDVDKFGFEPASGRGGGLANSASYDLDQPGVSERIALLFEEVAELFGELADGLVVELEFCDGEAPHRIPIYGAWAAANGRPSFEETKNAPFESRGYPLWHWRDFTTSRRIATQLDIEKAVRRKGFQGQFATLVELGNAPGVVTRNVNLPMLREAFPEWSLVTYDSVYDRRQNRLSTMEFCVDEPKQMGWEVHYLTRGVMTFTWPLDAPPMDLEEQWRLSLEDAVRHDPHTLWFMGSDARHDGLVCSNRKLPAWGYDDGRVARQRLMKLVEEFGLRR